jgi:hypothetical protein
LPSKREHILIGVSNGKIACAQHGVLTPQCACAYRPS